MPPYFPAISGEAERGTAGEVILSPPSGDSPPKRAGWGDHRESAGRVVAVAEDEASRAAIRSAGSGSPSCVPSVLVSSWSSSRWRRCSRQSSESCSNGVPRRARARPASLSAAALSPRASVRDESRFWIRRSSRCTRLSGSTDGHSSRA